VVTVVAPAGIPSVITGPQTVCENSQQSYSVINNPNVFYNWFLPSGWSGFTNSNSITVLTGSLGGSVSVNAENVCGASAPSFITVTVNPLPVAGFNYSPVANTVSFTSNSVNAVSWFWDFGDGVYSSQENPTHFYANVGSYNVLLVVSNACGVDSVWQNVNITVVGAEELINTSINLYPSPAKDFLYLEGDQLSLNQPIIISDVRGRLVSCHWSQAGKNLLKAGIEHLPAGMYILSMNGERHWRFVKE
jgi:PKD repeat protein